MSKKYTVFVSSTYTNLKDIRALVYKLILDCHHIPIGMENFGSQNATSLEVIKSLLDECDFQVTIIGGRYGSSVPGESKSYTEFEFDYALEKGIPVISYVQTSHQDDSIIFSGSENESLHRKLKKFIDKVRKFQSVNWHEEKDLLIKLGGDFNKLFNRNERPGWVRSDHAHDFKALTNELASCKEALYRNRRNVDEYNRAMEKLKMSYPNIGGFWKCEDKALFMHIHCDFGRIVSYFESGTHSHILSGLYHADKGCYVYDVVRIERDVKASTSIASTLLFGEIHSIGLNTFVTQVYGTNGRGSLPHDFKEKLKWILVDQH